MATINDFQKQIYKTIDILTEEKLKHLGFDRTLKGKVVSVGINDCKVKINGEDFTCKIKQGSKVNVGEVVFVKFPQNKDNDKYVDAVVSTSDNNGNLTLTAEQVLELLLTVDGHGSGLDADTLDGKHATDFALVGEIRATTFTHSQISPSNQWLISHNLSKYPSVTVVDSGQTVVLGDITYINENEIKINFSSEFSGKAFIN